MEELSVRYLHGRQGRHGCLGNHVGCYLRLVVVGVCSLVLHAGWVCRCWRPLHCPGSPMTRRMVDQHASVPVTI